MSCSTIDALPVSRLRLTSGSSALGNWHAPRTAVAALLGRRTAGSRAEATRRRCTPRRQLLRLGSVALAPTAACTGKVVLAKQRRSLLYVDCPAHASEIASSSGGFPAEVLEQLDVAVLGEHHPDLADKQLEVDFINDFARAKVSKRVALGLEMVEQPFQPVLDAFNRGEIDLVQLKKGVQWSKRWGWPFSSYAPVFEAARANGMPLVALETPTGLRLRVQLRGLEAITPEEQARYLPDPVAFAAAPLKPGFQSYSNMIVQSGYEDLLAAGMLASKDRSAATPDNFLASQMLRDEAIAAAVWRRLEGVAKEGSVEPVESMVVLVGYNHARFEFGLIRRLRRFGSGARRFRTTGDDLPVRSGPESSSRVVNSYPKGTTFEAAYLDDNPSSNVLRVMGGDGFVITRGASGESLVEALRSKPFQVRSIMLNPIPRDSNARERLNYALPVEGLPESCYPLFADYIWSDLVT